METLIWLVRHGKSARGFDQAEDPDLSELGHTQAEAVARQLNIHIQPCAVLASRFLRAQSTAKPLAALWERSVIISPEIDEIPAPTWMTGVNLPQRRPWLDVMLTESYGALDPTIESWRSSLLGFVSRLSAPTVLFTHYLTINALVGAAMEDLRTVVIDPGYCEVVTLRVNEGRVELL
ncbi:putative Phosphoglycerate mutase [Magnetospirillum sp. XM-1]|uniref:histidine phosphatase family protein n=1 Tax=Magnetospirillum sp. XM-1 TaxID=1663591 RepID=UPI00073DD6C2|nr:histidine phosphatase family protein [Magnetospirillum sp. XM-1]CUW39530.1 putative Phosphoglycerate mutase [Magnetospirillum sp. XM-1]